MKLPQLFPRIPHALSRKIKKLEATARRLPREGGDEREEPNMRLSSAFVVVLALHVVAVGGIYAFNSIKAARAPAIDPTYRPTVKEPASQKTGEAGSQVAPAALTTTPAAPAAATHRVHHVKAGETLARIAADHHVTVDDLEEANGLKSPATLRAGQELKVPLPPPSKPRTSEKKPGGSPAKASAMVRDSGETYIVAKADNPVAIARKFGVSYEELLKLNKIEDPKKLRIGTKLRLPAKAKPQPKS